MDGFQLLLLAMLVTFTLLACGWWWMLIIRPTRQAWQARASMPLIASLALQFTVAMTLVTTALGFGGPLWTLALPVAWPMLWLLSPPLQTAAAISQNAAALVGGLLSALATAGAMIAVRRSLLRYVLLPCAIIGTAATFLLAEQRSAARMEERAAALGADCLARHRFWTSLTFWGEEFQWDLHALARIDGEWHGWSYRNDDFYLIPDSAPKDGNGLQAECLAQIVR